MVTIQRRGDETVGEDVGGLEPPEVAGGTVKRGGAAAVEAARRVL